MSTRKSSSSRLGRGLGSLIPTAPTPTAADAQYFYCDVERIDAMPGQPRRRFDQERLEELSTSIKESGLIQPLVVRESGEGRYELIAGERRLRASKLAGLKELPVVVREVTDSSAFALALIENIQREDLNPIEEALAYARLVEEHGFTQEDLATRVGKSRPAVANSLRLLKLSPLVRDLVSDGLLSAGHARAVLSVDDEYQAPLAERIITEGLSVRQAEELARAFKKLGPGETRDGEAPVTPRAVVLTPQLKAVQRQLMERLGAKVVLSKKASGAGSIEVHFADDDGLQSILDQIFT